MSEAAIIPERPLLKPWYRLAQVEEGILLEHGRSVVVFSGAAAGVLLPALLPLLDGTRTLHEIVDVVGVRVAPAVEKALRLLAEHELLTAGPRLVADPRGRRAVVETLAASAGPGPTMSELGERLAAARIRVVGEGPLLDPLTRLLHLSGVDDARRGSDTEADGFTIVAPGPAEPGLCSEWNRRALRDGETWIPVGESDGRTFSIGPLIVPHESACYRCLELRRESTSGCAHELAQLRETPVATVPCPAVLAAAAALAAEIVVRWIATDDPALPGTVFTLETTPHLRVESHLVLRVPRCSDCSPAAGTAPQSPWHEARVA